LLKKTSYDIFERSLKQIYCSSGIDSKKFSAFYKGLVYWCNNYMKSPILLLFCMLLYCTKYFDLNNVAQT